MDYANDAVRFIRRKNIPFLAVSKLRLRRTHVRLKAKFAGSKAFCPIPLKKWVV